MMAESALKYAKYALVAILVTGFPAFFLYALSFNVLAYIYMLFGYVIATAIAVAVAVPRD